MSELAVVAPPSSSSNSNIDHHHQPLSSVSLVSGCSGNGSGSNSSSFIGDNAGKSSGSATTATVLLQQQQIGGVAVTATTTTSSPIIPAVIPSKIVIAEGDLNGLSVDDWLTYWRQQDSYVTFLERRVSQQEGELDDLRQSSERIRGQLTESQQRERVLVRRLTAKEQETQDYVCQLNELKTLQSATAVAATTTTPSTAASTTTTTTNTPSSAGTTTGGLLLRSTILDPSVNCLLQQLRNELQVTRAKLEDTQNELAAWKFTPDSNTGKRLMAKCRLLYQENEELGRMTSSGRLAKLESDLALQKSFSEEVRKSQNELDAFLADLDEDVEGMQSTILFLQQELRKSKDVVQELQKENVTLKLSTTTTTTTIAAATTSPITVGGSSSGGGGGNNNNSSTSTSNNGCRTNGDSNSVCGEPDNHRIIVDSDTDIDRTTRLHHHHMINNNNNGGVIINTSNKRLRRSSVLSIDYNEDDTLVINTNGDVAMSSDPE